MKGDVIDELVSELDQLARDYPDQPQWAELLHRVRKEKNMPDAHRKPPSPSTNAPESIGTQSCSVCDAADAVQAGTMCADCTAMYRPISARAVPGSCDCGHPADGPKVYVCRKGNAEQTLCGLRCVQSHFQEQFRSFLGGPR